MPASHWRHARDVIVTAEEIDLVHDTIRQRDAVDADEARLAAATRSLSTADWEIIMEADNAPISTLPLRPGTELSPSPTSECESPYA